MISKIKCYIGKRFSKQIDSIYALRTSVLKCVFYLCRVRKEKIVFINFNGRGFGCNPKYIALEMLRRNKSYDLVWLIDNLSDAMPSGIRKVKYHSVRALYEVATAKVIVTNVKNDLRLVKKRKQYVVQTWHGSFASKEVEARAQNHLSPQYVRESKKNSKQTDLFLSNSRMLTNSYRESFWCTCEIFECGLPRNDALFSLSEENKKRVRQLIGVEISDSLILYAPTFRDDGSLDAYSIDCLSILNVMNQGTKRWKILIRLHPNVGAIKGLFPEHPYIFDVSTYPDMQELLVVSDILITDYSSTVFEFAAMQKQSFTYAPDLEKYQELRGLNPAFFDLPNKICRNNQELLKEMADYSDAGAKVDSKRFLEKVGGIDDGHASERVVNRIEQWMTECV